MDYCEDLNSLITMHMLLATREIYTAPPDLYERQNSNGAYNIIYYSVKVGPNTYILLFI